MRTWIIGAAALFAVAAPGVAAAEGTGYVGVTYGNIDIDGLGDIDTYGVEGAVAFQGSKDISFEIDGAISDSDDADTAWGATGHLFTRNDQHLLGGFVGFADSDDSTTWIGGLEGNAYLNTVTLAGAVYYADNNDADIDGYGVNGEARYFLTDNFRLQGNLGWANIDSALGDDNAFIYGVGGEYQFAAAPISIAAGYNRVELDDANVDADAFSVALRYNFGGTLRDRDRNGASQASLTGVSSALGL